MMNYGTGFGFGGLWMILFLVLIVAVIVMIVKGTMRASSSSQSPTQQTPLQILEQRYARGELEREEFLQKKHDLEHRADD
jgi:putative membrane protein